MVSPAPPSNNTLCVVNGELKSNKQSPPISICTFNFRFENTVTFLHHMLYI